MDGQWHANVGERIRLEAERSAVRSLVKAAVRWPGERQKSLDLAIKWGLLGPYTDHLLKTYRRLNRRFYG